MQNICVFCGSSIGTNTIYKEKAVILGRYLAEKQVTLVYGGGNIGLMGEISQTVLDNGGEVIGVIPEDIYNRVPIATLTHLHVVANMHERKDMMYKLADGFIIMPGGIGTIEEFFEIYTWYQLGYHIKPIGILNINNYYNYILQFIDHMVCEGFLKQEHRNSLLDSENPKIIVDRLLNHKMINIDKLK